MIMQSLLHAQINYSNNSERATVDSDTHKGKNKGAVIKSYKKMHNSTCLPAEVILPRTD